MSRFVFNNEGNKLISFTVHNDLPGTAKLRDESFSLFLEYP